MPDESGDQSLARRLRGVIAARDEEISVLEAQVRATVSRLDAAAERIRRQDLRIAELERRLGMDSSDSGTPSSKEGIGAKADRKAREKKARQESEQERDEGRKRGGQPGRQGKGLERDPAPTEARTAEPRRSAGPATAPWTARATPGTGGAQVTGIEVLRKVTEVLLPGLACRDCGAVTWADAPAGCRQGSVAYGPVLNGAAVLLSCYGNVPAERAARLIGMLTGQDVSPGWIDKAVARMNAGLLAAGFDEAMLAALAAEDALAAGETPVNVLDKTPLPEPEPDAGPEEKKGGKEAGGQPFTGVRT